MYLPSSVSVLRTTRCVLLPALLLGSLTSAPRAQAPCIADPWYAVDPFDPFLWTFDPGTGASSGALITMLPGSIGSGIVVGGNGLARHPGTGQLWSLLQEQGTAGRTLATLDPTTGSATFVALLGDKFSSITFDSTGTLWGLTGDGASLPEFLHTIDTVTGLPTVVMHLGNGDAGEVIAFNPDDGLLYHWSGGSVPITETIDPVTLAITRVPRTGDDPAPVPVHGAGYLGNGVFVATALDEIYLLEASGQGTFVASGGGAMVFRGVAPTQTAASVCSDPWFGLKLSLNESWFDTFDGTVGVRQSSLQVALAGSPGSGAVLDGLALAKDPITGDLVCVLEEGGTPNRVLARMDTQTGLAMYVGNLGDQFTGLTFDAAGTLYGVTGDMANVPETLFTIDKATAVATPVLALGAGSEGEAIAYNPDDGFIYHWSGAGPLNAAATGKTMDRIDPVGLTVTPIALSGFHHTRVIEGAGYIGGGEFLVTTEDNSLIRITTAGVMTFQVASGFVWRGVVPVTSDPVGTNYCAPSIPNSTGFGATISGMGSASAASNDLTLIADQLPPGQFGYFLAGQTQGIFNPPGSQGVLCIVGNIGRFNQVAQIIQGPTDSVLIDTSAIPVNPTVGVLAGDTWSFQCWFRDNNPGGTSNFTDGLAVLFL